jgi:hypothetical protein
MQGKVLKPFVFMILVMAVVSLACSLFGGSGTPATEAPPVQAPPVEQPSVQPSTQPAPTEESQPVQEETPQVSDTSDSGFNTFTDQNSLYTIEVPSDWTYEQTVDTENNYYYIDTFTSPDGGAVIENIVYDDGERFTGSQKGKFALYLLNTFYSSTGKEGDIKVTDDSIQKDGSERLIWTSKGGGYSGISFLELRSNGTTFLFFTVDWGDSVKDTYIDTLNYVIESYAIP